MSEGVELEIGAVVDCEDGECGRLLRVVIDSATDAITHLVVEPRDRRRGEKARLVPMDLVEAEDAHDVRLRCTLAGFEALPSAEVTEVTSGFDATTTPSKMVLFGLRGVGPQIAMAGTGLHGPIRIGPHAVTEEDLQAGEGEVWRGQRVHAPDGPIGHVYGLVVDAAGHVSHVLLGEGHLWGKKQVSIPIGAVKTVVDDGVYLNLTKKQVGDLPSVDLERIG